MSSVTIQPSKQRIRGRAVRGILGRVVLYTVLIVLAFLFAMPFLWMVSSALKNDRQTYAIPPVWIPIPARFLNFPEALTHLPFGKYFLNTLRIVLPVSAGTLFSCTLVAYGFARLQWSLRDPLFFICVATMMIPFQVRMIPLFLVFRNLKWINSYKPLTVPSWFGNAYFIFMLRQFFMTIPQDLSDAAKIDGCGELRTLTSIFLPLARPALAVVGLFSIMWSWNDYLGPLIYINDAERYPVALALQHLEDSGTGILPMDLIWPYLMAASTATIVPILLLYFFTQRTFIEGIALTGIKG